MRLTKAGCRRVGLCLSLAVAFSLSSCVAYAGPGVWTTGGPYGGEIYALAIDPASPATLYAGAWMGGVFKSTNSGTTWTVANTGLTDWQVNALAIDPATPRTLYVGTDDGGVFKSTNAGDTWTATSTACRMRTSTPWPSIPTPRPRSTPARAAGSSSPPTPATSGRTPARA